MPYFIFIVFFNIVINPIKLMLNLQDKQRYEIYKLVAIGSIPICYA